MNQNRNTPRRLCLGEFLEPRRVMTAAAPLSVFDDLVAGADDYSAQNNVMTLATDLGTVSGPSRIQGRVGGADPTDFFRFHLDHASEVSIGLDQLYHDIDLFLYESDGSYIDGSFLIGANSESLSLRLEEGSYFVEVAPWLDNVSSYRLTVDADNGGNSRSRATDLGLFDGQESIRGWAGPADTRDYFRFQLDRSESVQIDLSGLSGDLDVYLYDHSGRVLERSLKGGSSAEQMSRTLSAGTYYVSVQPWGRSESYYDLTISSLGSGEADSLPPVPYFGGANDWNLNAINAPEAWAADVTGTGVVVAVLDTGVDYYHSELFDNIWSNEGEIPYNGVDDDGNGYVDDHRGWDFAYGDNRPYDMEGHGTHVAGTIAAANDGRGSTGVAHDAEIMPVQVLDAEGSGSQSALSNGIRYAVDNGADIINLSLGGGYNRTVRNAVRYAESHGVLIVAASGNDSSSAPDYPARHAAAFSNVISVGAHTRYDQRSYFSNRVGWSGAVQVDAPGSSIYSTTPRGRYDTYSGTSMAAPHVAGLAGLILSANPNLNPSEVRELIVEGASQTISGSDSIGGIDASVSVALALSANSPTAASTDFSFDSFSDFGIEEPQTQLPLSIGRLDTENQSLEVSQRSEPRESDWNARLELLSAVDRVLEDSEFLPGLTLEFERDALELYPRGNG